MPIEFAADVELVLGVVLAFLLTIAIIGPITAYLNR